MIEVALKDCDAKSYGGNYFLCAIASMSSEYNFVYVIPLCLLHSSLQIYKEIPIPMEKNIIHCDLFWEQDKKWK